MEMIRYYSDNHQQTVTVVRDKKKRRKKIEVKYINRKGRVFILYMNIKWFIGYVLLIQNLEI